MGELVQNHSRRAEVERVTAAALRLTWVIGDAWLELAADPILLLDSQSLEIHRANGPARDLLGESGALEVLLTPADGAALRDAVAALRAGTAARVRVLRLGIRAGDGWESAWLGAGLLPGRGGEQPPMAICLLRRETRQPAPRLRLLRSGHAVGGDEPPGLPPAVIPWSLHTPSGMLDTGPLWGTKAAPETLDDWLELLHEDDRQRVRWELLTHIRGLSARVESECRMRRGDGSERWIRLQGVLEDGGQLVGSLQDISRERDLAAALEASEARFRQLLARSPDAVLVHRSGRLLHINEAMCSLLGWERPEELVGEPLLKYVHADDVERFCRQVLAVRAGAEPAEAQPLRLLHRDGAAVPVEAVSLWIDYDGAPAVVTQARDTTAREALQARKALADRMITLGNLAAGVAHEINNPLTFMYMNLSAVVAALPKLQARLQALEGPQSRGGGWLSELSTQLEESLEGARRIRDIVNDLRRFSRESDEPPGPVSLARAVGLAVTLCRNEYKYKAHVVTEVSEGLWVRGHESRLSQMILNLVLNAAQAMVGSDTARNEIRLEGREEDGEGVIRVIDTGAGIPPEHLQRLFEPGFTTKALGLGTGLGLAICRHVVESYGGSIQVESQLGRGTCVTVRLPLAEPPEELARGAESREQPPAGALRVLVIDDEPALCRALRRALCDEYEVVTASGGAEALALLGGDTHFDVILCDLMMPGLAGVEILEWLSARHPGLAERVIFLTGGAVEARDRHFVEEVDNVVLDKPLDMKLLRQAIRRISRAGQPGGERRRGRRFPGGGLRGLLEVAERVWQVDVVDYSASGLRLRGPHLEHMLCDQHPISVVLRSPGEVSFVRAELGYVREVQRPGAVERCFVLEAMDDRSQATYSGWLDRAASFPSDASDSAL